MDICIRVPLRHVDCYGLGVIGVTRHCTPEQLLNPSEPQADLYSTLSTLWSLGLAIMGERDT
jgi:hypothetical protein